MNSYPVFLINLDGSTDRLDAARAVLDLSQVEFTRISAFDGRKTDPLTFPEYDSALARSYMGRDLLGGEIGCFLSHVRAAQAFIATGAPFGLVLEDDMLPAPDAFGLVQATIDWQTLRGTPDWHLINLGAQRVKFTSTVVTITSGTSSSKVCRAHYFPMLTTALLWSREGAKEFLRTWQPIICPVDNYARKWLIEADMGLAIWPAPFGTSGAQSDIAAAGPTKSRSLTSRSRSYQWQKLKRLNGDKVRAFCHKLKFAARAQKDHS